MDVVDAINQLPTWDATSVFGGAFTDLPLIDFVNDGSPIVEENLVTTAVSELIGEAPFVMNAGLNDAWYNPGHRWPGFFRNRFSG